MKAFAVTNLCPCGRMNAKSQPLRYGDCCGRYLESDTPAPDAESLMRSRYCAFVLERELYLLATWHASHRPATIAFEQGVRWLGLEVRQHLPIDADHAEVEFLARQKPLSGSAVRLHERSRFVCEGGRWLYLDGDLR